MRRRAFLTGAVAASALTAVPWRDARGEGGEVYRYKVQQFLDPFAVFQRWQASPQWLADLTRVGTRAMVARLDMGLRDATTITTDRLNHLESLARANGWAWLAQAIMGNPKFLYPALPTGTIMDWDPRYNPQHIIVALQSWKQIQMIGRAVFGAVPSPEFMALEFRRVLSCSGYQRIATSPWNQAYAQEPLSFPTMDPVTITAPYIDPVSLQGVGASPTSSNMPQLMSNYTRMLCQQHKIVIPGNATCPEGSLGTPTAIDSTFGLNPGPVVFDDYTREQFLDKLDRQSVPDTEALAVWGAFGAALGLLARAAPITRAGMDYITQGLVGGAGVTFGMRVAFIGAGSFTVIVVGLPIVILGFAAIYMTYNTPVPPANQPRVNTDGFMLPLMGSPEAAVAP